METSLSASLDDAQQGDRVALQALCSACRPWLVKEATRRIVGRLRTSVDPEDVAHGVLADVLRLLPRIELRGEASFRAWLRTLVKRRIAGRRRSLSSPAGLQHEVKDDVALAAVLCRQLGPGVELERREQDRRVQFALGSLAPADRDILLLRHELRLGFAAIQKRLGLKSVDAARMRHVRALARLARLLETKRPVDKTEAVRADPAERGRGGSAGPTRSADSARRKRGRG